MNPAENASSEFTNVELTHEVIDYEALTKSVRRNDCGAVVLFLGTVRDLTGDRQTTALEYEAYPEMAISQIRQLIDQTRDRWPIRQCGVIHRLGHLDPGETAVAIAVSSPHRREAFEAAQHLMNEIKKSVPIWKKEEYADGKTEWIHPGLTDPPQP